MLITPTSSPKGERQLSRERSFRSIAKPVDVEVKTRDIYGFEVDARRSQSYRLFYEKFLLHTQRQSLKASSLMESGVFKKWSCLYAKNRRRSDIVEFEKVEELVRSGLPSTCRGEIWLQLTGVASKVKVYPGVYESLLEPYEQAEQNGIYNSPSTIQIDKDVPRTFPGYIWTPKGKKFQPALRRLLRAYAMRNPRLGYCQSMNFIAGGLLLFLEEEEAFWMLCFIVEEMLPDYFTKNIIGPQIDAEVLTELMGEQLPELRDHFECKGVNTVLVSTQWFMCLFIRTLPFECAFRIWDSLFLYGPQVLFEVGLAILKMHQKELLTLEDTTDIVTHLGNSLSDLFDCSSIWEIAVARVDHKRIGSSREIHKERVMRDMRMKKDILDLMDAIPHSKFSRETLEELYIQYANLSPKLDDEDVVATGLPKSVFHKVISRICQWKHEEYFMDRLFKMFDTNCNQRVDFKELISGLSILIKGTNEEKLRMCFVLFDRNSDGYVDRDELREMLTSLYTLCNGTSESSKPVPIQNGGSLSSHSLLVQNGGLLLQNGAHCTNTLTHSGGAQSTNSLTHSGGAQSTNSLTHSGGAQSSTPSTPPTPVSAARSFLVRVQSSRLLQLGLGSPSLTQNGSAPEPAKPKAPASDPTQHKAPANDPAQATTTRGASDPARPKLFASDPGRTTPPASDPEKDKNATPDYSSEVAFFVDMLFKKADVTKDGLLSPTEFREAALLHPFILKTFNLDHQQNYDVRISIE